MVPCKFNTKQPKAVGPKSLYIGVVVSDKGYIRNRLPKLYLAKRFGILVLDALQLRT